MCDTFVSLPGATADRSVILAKNSDREPNEAHEVVVVPGGSTGGGIVRATYIDIPQVRRTYTTLLAKPYWIWGAEMGVNEHGVAIGNEAVFTKVPREQHEGLLGMDMLRLALERSASAQEAVDVLGTLLVRYGQAGQAGHTHALQYDNSFIVSDREEAWVVETAGRDWVAERVTGSRSISNGLTIGEQWDRSSGVAGHFARENSDFLYTRFSDSSARQCRTTDALAAMAGSVDVRSAMCLLRDHGPRGEHPGWSPARGLTGQTVCAHAGSGPIRVAQTTGSMVTHVTADSVTAYVTATSAPCTSVFKPVWLDTGLPDLGSPGKWYDPAALWWRHEDLHRATLVDYPDRIEAYLTHREVLEEELVSAAARCEEPAARRDLTRRAFAGADAAEALWLADIERMPARRNPLPYRRAWAGFDRLCGRTPG